MNDTTASYPPQIVVINAEDEFLKVVRDLLEEDGYHVTTLHVTEQPFDRIVELQPVVIVLDFLYETPDAWNLLAQLDADERTRTIPLLATSTDEELIKRVTAQAMSRVASGMLLKPMELDALVEEVDRLAGFSSVVERQATA